MTSPLGLAAHHYKELRSRLLESFPDLAEDEQALLDTLDGETELTNKLAAILRSALHDEAMTKGLQEYQGNLARRMSALRDRARKKRAVVLHFMEDVGLKKLEAPDMTATRKVVPPSVTVFDENQLPKEFVRVKSEPDKSAIKAALKEGQDVPGAQLGNTSEILQVKI